jgi:hypothetical protein
MRRGFGSTSCSSFTTYPSEFSKNYRSDLLQGRYAVSAAMAARTLSRAAMRCK